MRKSGVRMAGFRQSLRPVPDESFGSMLRARRFEANETQAELAARLGTRQQTIGAWERGERPQRRFLRQLADYVGLAGGEDALNRLLDQERDIRSIATSDRGSANLPETGSTEAAIVAAFTTVVRAGSAKIAAGVDLSDSEVTLMRQAMETLQRHLET